jgi:release factor glutamine methyltransferase
VTTIRELLNGARARLGDSDTPFLDSLVLLEWASGVNRETILAEQPADAGTYLGTGQLQRFLTAVEQRATGRPIAYIIGEKEFYGRPFAVGPGVLVPRPDSEVLVTRALELLETLAPRRNSPLHIHDCCTGSGCIGLSIALEYTELRSAPLFLTLSDVDDTALAWARRNIDRLVAASQLTVTLRRSDLLVPGAPTDSDTGDVTADLVTANPPYLTTAETAAALDHGWSEPALALDAGESGMEAIDRLVPQAFSYLRPGGYLVVEHGATQAAQVARRMNAAGFEAVVSRRDLAGRERCTEGRTPE